MDISVVVPVFDAAGFLAEAVASAGNQTLAPVEIIVVNDGSTDGSADVARLSGARVVSQGRRGPAHARNVGAALCRADLVAFLDADDVMLADRLERQAAFLDGATDDIVGVFGHIGQLARDDAGRWMRVGRPAVPGLLPSTLTVHRERFLATGGFATDLTAGELIDWVARCRSGGFRLPVLDDTVALRRAHAANLTRDRARTEPGYLEVARRAIERGRRQ